MVCTDLQLRQDIIIEQLRWFATHLILYTTLGIFLFLKSIHESQCPLLNQIYPLDPDIFIPIFGIAP